PDGLLGAHVERVEDAREAQPLELRRQLVLLSHWCSPRAPKKAATNSLACRTNWKREPTGSLPAPGPATQPLTGAASGHRPVDGSCIGHGSAWGPVTRIRLRAG